MTWSRRPQLSFCTRHTAAGKPCCSAGLIAAHKRRSARLPPPLLPQLCEGQLPPDVVGCLAIMLPSSYQVPAQLPSPTCMKAAAPLSMPCCLLFRPHRSLPHCLNQLSHLPCVFRRASWRCLLPSAPSGSIWAPRGATPSPAAGRSSAQARAAGSIPALVRVLHSTARLQPAVCSPHPVATAHPHPCLPAMPCPQQGARTRCTPPPSTGCACCTTWWLPGSSQSRCCGQVRAGGLLAVRHT